MVTATFERKFSSIDSYSADRDIIFQIFNGVKMTSQSSKLLMLSDLNKSSLSITLKRPKKGPKAKNNVTSKLTVNTEKIYNFIDA